jgi:hypothetical protein
MWRPLQWLLGALLIPLATPTLTEYLPIQAEPVCLTQARIVAPAAPEPIAIDRLAWPVGGPGMPEPLTVNGRAPAVRTPELICMAGCPEPPCQPVTSCPMGALHWSVRYTGLVVEPGARLLLPDTQAGAIPPMMMMFYNLAGGVAFTPSPQAGPQPVPTPHALPYQTGGGGSACSDSPATPLAITFSILFGLASLGLVGVWQQRRRLPCPYCSSQLLGGAVAVREHLKNCGEHLMLFQPVILETVHRVVDRQTIHLEVPGDQEEREDLIARPEAGQAAV